LVERAIRIAAGKAKARAKSDNQTKKTVCAVEGCGTELSRRKRHCLKDGTEICHRCHQSKWNEGNSEEEFLVERARFLAAKMRAEAKSSVKAYQGGSERRDRPIVSLKDVEASLSRETYYGWKMALMVYAESAATLRKTKWNNGNSEEEFLVERARRLAADKAIAGAKSQNN
jgi:hypothetical protein